MTIVLIGKTGSRYIYNSQSIDNKQHIQKCTLKVLPEPPIRQHGVTHKPSPLSRGAGTPKLSR